MLHTLKITFSNGNIIYLKKVNVGCIGFNGDGVNKFGYFIFFTIQMGGGGILKFDGPARFIGTTEISTSKPYFI